MKHKALTVFAVLLVLAGLTMLIVPRISIRVGEQIAHSAIEDFKALKSQATADELTDRKEADEDNTVCVFAKKHALLQFRNLNKLQFQSG